MAAKQYDHAPDMQIDPSKSYTAHFTTDKGAFDVELFAKDAPMTVNNFVFLAKDGFYDDLKFHRVISNFVIQGGCPFGTGTGGPGYKWNDEASALKIPHDTGVLSMANAGPNTNGSQFFVTHSPQPHLNGKHAVFGKVLGDGMTVVNTISQGDRIHSITISEA